MTAATPTSPAAPAPAIPDAAALDAAWERVRPHVHQTPVMRSASLDAACGGAVFCKCESLQKGGAFKIRGATNALFALADDDLRGGVVTHSSGNHGQALALAARLRGVAATVVAPRDAAAPKLAAMRAYGAEVVLCEPTHQAREETAATIVRERGARLVHPYDDPLIVAGQATVARELADEVPDLDLLLAPIGGGGLLAGTALAAARQAPRARVVGAEPAGADDAARSLAAGRVVAVARPDTIADGLRATIGELPLAVLRRHAVEIVTVDDAAIVAAMRWVWERMKLVIEPSAAVAVAVLLGGRLDVAGRRVGLILSGGNVDLDRLPW